MKKIISIAISLIMIISMVQTAAPVMAANDVTTVTPLVWTGWTSGTTNYSTVTNEVYHGANGYSLKFPANPEAAYNTIRNQSVAGLGAGNYTLTFYSYPVTRRFIYVTFDFATAADKKYDWNWANPVLQDDGWYKHTMSLTINEADTLKEVYFEVNASGNNIDKDMYLDDISLTLDGGDGTNLIANGDFEKYVRDNTIIDYTLPVGWSPALNGNATQDVMDTLYSVVNNISATDSNSLKVSAIGQPSNCQYYLRPTILSGTDANTYVLSVKVNKATYLKLDTNMKVFDTNKQECANLNLKWQNSPTVDAYGWCTYTTGEFTTSAAIKTIDFSVNESTEEFYIDDLTLTKVGGDGTNYVSNGSFESVPAGSYIQGDTEPYGELCLPASWYQASSSGAVNLVDAFFNTTSTDAYSGSNALIVNNDRFTNNDNIQILLRNDKAIKAYAGNYIYTMYVKCDGTPYIKVGFDGADSSFTLEYWATSNDYTVEDAGNGWKKITYKLAVSNMLTGFYIMNYGAAENLLIDKVSLISVASGEELIRNGDFEGAYYTPGEYYPLNVLSGGTANGAYISWKNPASENLADVKLYNITSGDEALLANDFTDTPGAYNSLGTALAAKGEYAFKLVFDFNSHDSTEYIVTGNSLRKNYNTGSWTEYAHTNSRGYVPVVADIDTNEHCSGKNTFKLVSNIAAAESGYYYELNLPVTLEAGASYELTANIKTLNAQSGFSLGIDWGRNISVSGTTPWTKYKKIIKNDSLTSTSLKIIVDNSADGIWLDDIKLYKLAGNVPTGSNLVADYSFESNAVSYCDDVTATAKGMDGALEISWIKNGENSTLKAYNVYKLSDGNYEKVASVYKNQSKLKLTNLINGEEYSYLVKAVNLGGTESDGRTVAGTPTQKVISGESTLKKPEGSFVIKNRSFSAYGDDLSLTQPYVTQLSDGLLAASMYVKNTSDEAKTLTMFMTLYKNDEVVDITDISKTISCTAHDMPGEVLTTVIRVPEQDGNKYKVGLMVWENTSNLKPLVDVMILE